MGKEAKEKAEKEAKEKAEKEAKEKAEAEKKAKENTEGEHAAKQKAEKEKVEAEKVAKEKLAAELAASREEDGAEKSEKKIPVALAGGVLLAGFLLHYFLKPSPASSSYDKPVVVLPINNREEATEESSKM